MRFPAVLTPDTLGSLLRSKRFSEAQFVEDDMAGTVMVTRGGFSAGYPVRGDAANTSRIDVSYFSKGEKRRPTAAQRAKKVAAVARIAALLGQAYKVRMNPAGTSLVVTVPAAKASRSAVKHNPPVNVLYDLHTGNPLRITSMTPAFIAVAEPFSITLKQARAALESQDVQAHSAAQIMEAARTHADTDVTRRGPANRVFVRVGNEFHAVAVGTGGGSAKANGAQRAPAKPATAFRGYSTPEAASRYIRNPYGSDSRMGGVVSVRGEWFVPVWFGVTTSYPWGTSAVLLGRGGNVVLEGVEAVRDAVGV